MRPQRLLTFLGLCNVVAGALLVAAPERLVPLDGIELAAGRLLTLTLALFLVASGLAAWLVPAPARRVYLWIFGVGLKGCAALLWGGAALVTDGSALWIGGGADIVVAAVCAVSLIARSEREPYRCGDATL